jgi:hypothetical protein
MFPEWSSSWVRIAYDGNHLASRGNSVTKLVKCRGGKKIFVWKINGGEVRNFLKQYFFNNYLQIKHLLMKNYKSSRLTTTQRPIGTCRLSASRQVLKYPRPLSPLPLSLSPSSHARRPAEQKNPLSIAAVELIWRPRFIQIHWDSVQGPTLHAKVQHIWIFYLHSQLYTRKVQHLSNP